MANQWSLSRLLEDLHRDIEGRLEIARRNIGHPGEKGDASESIWRDLLSKYLPKRYEVRKAFVVDSQGNFSYQLDVVIFDRQYTPFIFDFEDLKVIPAESVYAVFECKQTINKSIVEYAQGKAESVRRLHRTSIGIPHAGGRYEPKPPAPIIAGILAFESDWSRPFGDEFLDALHSQNELNQLDVGCVASHGTFHRLADSSYELNQETKPATAFLFLLISMLQEMATVPMLDVTAYAEWLSPNRANPERVQTEGA